MAILSLVLASDIAPPTCQNCGLPSPDELEISRLVQDAGELQETPVVALLQLCRDCLELITSGRWEKLSDRARNIGRPEN
jgi:hypothetical protein